MRTWNQYIKKVEEWSENTSTGCSEKKHILMILFALYALDIEVPEEQIPRSNLKTMIKPIKTAIANRHTARINEILHMASTMGNADFRIALGTCRREKVEVGEILIGPPKYHLVLTRDQYLKVKRKTKLMFNFVEV